MKCKIYQFNNYCNFKLKVGQISIYNCVHYAHSVILYPCNIL